MMFVQKLLFNCLKTYLLIAIFYILLKYLLIVIVYISIKINIIEYNSIIYKNFSITE